MKTDEEQFKEDLLKYLENRRDYYKTCSKLPEYPNDHYFATTYSIAIDDITNGRYKTIINFDNLK